jgi:hypothetical protein
MNGWLFMTLSLYTASNKMYTGAVQVIEVCEKLAECDAQVNNVPVGVLKAARGFLRLFQWAKDAADRLAFAEVLATNEDFTADMTETYKVCSLYTSLCLLRWLLRTTGSASGHVSSKPSKVVNCHDCWQTEHNHALNLCDGGRQRLTTLAMCTSFPVPILYCWRCSLCQEVVAACCVRSEDRLCASLGVRATCVHQRTSSKLQRTEPGKL